MTDNTSIIALDERFLLLQASGLLILVLAATYITYQRWFHPIAKYPGPFVASLTGLYKFYYAARWRTHDKLGELHDQYGPVMRVGPNDLHFRSNDALAPIYKNGRKTVKTPFYNAFTAFNPTVFGTQDEDIHALRRRQMAHAFSLKNISDMEFLLDEQLRILCSNIENCATKGTVFDLKDYIARYILDVLGEVAYSRPFGSQHFDPNAEYIPEAVRNHFLLATMIGHLPFQSLTKALAARSPIPWIRHVVESRGLLKDICRKCVARRIENPSERTDLLSGLINAKDPVTGATLEEIDINTEAYSMLVAGSHTTSSTLSLFFQELMTHPDCMAKAKTELAEKLSAIPKEAGVYQAEGLEAKLPYISACLNENFRKNPVSTLSLWRAVAVAPGIQIAGEFIPQGTRVAMSNFVSHHDPNVWGSDHDRYDPSRWYDERAKGKEDLLFPFSTGHRMCLGKNLAMTNIYKTVSTILTKFELERVDVRKEDEPVFRSHGVAELDKPVLCKARIRTAIS